MNTSMWGSLFAHWARQIPDALQCLCDLIVARVEERLLMLVADNVDVAIVIHADTTCVASLLLSAVLAVKIP
jgi:hypothetical protein